MASKPKLPISFTPVPVRPRHDGWTAERQIAFLEKLADTGSITAACKHVGMSRESVRRLRPVALPTTPDPTGASTGAPPYARAYALMAQL